MGGLGVLVLAVVVVVICRRAVSGRALMVVGPLLKTGVGTVLPLHLSLLVALLSCLNPPYFGLLVGFDQLLGLFSLVFVVKKP